MRPTRTHVTAFHTRLISIAGKEEFSTYVVLNGKKYVSILDFFESEYCPKCLVPYDVFETTSGKIALILQTEGFNQEMARELDILGFTEWRVENIPFDEMYSFNQLQLVL